MIFSPDQIVDQKNMDDQVGSRILTGMLWKTEE